MAEADTIPVNQVLAREHAHNRELLLDENKDLEEQFEEVIHKPHLNIVDSDNPLKPPSTKANSLVWPDTNALNSSNIYLPTKTFRQRALFSHAKNCSVIGDQEWAHSVLRDSFRVTFHGDVKMDSYRDGLGADFMYNTAGGFALSENFRASDVRYGGGKTIVGDSVKVEKADETSHFLVSGKHDITNIGKDARIAQNISEFRGSWEELEDFFTNKVDRREKCILGVTGFEKSSYDSLRDLRIEIQERRENWSPVAYQNIGYLDTEPRIIDAFH